MGERDIGDTVTLVDFNPDQGLGVGSVLDVVTAVVRENGSVTSAEIKGARLGSSEEDGGAGLALVEVEPFFGLL